MTKNDGLFLFLHKDRITKAIEDHFATENATDIVHIRDYDKVEEELKAYVSFCTVILQQIFYFFFLFTGQKNTWKTYNPHLSQLHDSIKYSRKANH